MSTPRTVLSLFVLLALLLGSAPARAGRAEREVDRLAKLLQIGPGSVVADIGAGKGEQALAIARIVGPGGTVYATELDPALREHIARAALREGLANVVVVEALEDGTGLPDGCCDAAYMRGVYHHLTAPASFLTSLHRSLRPGARLAVIDFRPTRWLALWKPKGVPPDRQGHGILPEIVVREAEGAGFEPVTVEEDWPASFLIARYAAAFRRL